MSEKTRLISEMIEILPDEEQNLAFEFIKRLVLAWDNDYTKVTTSERKKIDNAENSGFIDDKDIDWDNLEKYSVDAPLPDEIEVINQTENEEYISAEDFDWE